MDMAPMAMLEDILRRLPPRALAVSRSVCKAWRATVDRLQLLRADLLPTSVDAVIFEVNHLAAPKLFARRSTTRYVTSRLDYLEARPSYRDLAGGIRDHCNGLLLILDNKVVNPATRQWASLPRLPCSCVFPTRCGRCYHSNRYLVYDPAVSPHYQVLLIPRVPREEASDAEWPPSPYVIHVFSSDSETNCWKEKSFVRQGDAAGTVDDVRSHWKSDELMYYSAYWKGSLYVPSRHRKDGFVLRINLSNDKYQVIKLPEGGIGSLFRIGKSKKGVYCALHIDGRSTFQIWFLSESQKGVMDWVLNNEISFETAWTIYPCKGIDNNAPWISQSLDQKELLLQNDVNLKVVHEYNDALSKDGFGWDDDSDDENLVTTVDWPKRGNPAAPAPFFSCLGFHPYKDIALFHDDYRSATFAYYFDSSKARYLGVMEHEHSEVEISFAYTPCWTMDLPGSN